MDLRAIEDLTVKTIVEAAQPGILEIEPEATLIEDLGFDSLDRIELAMRLEDAFNLAPIPSATAHGWRTVQDVIGSMRSILEVEDGQLS